MKELSRFITSIIRRDSPILSLITDPLNAQTLVFQEQNQQEKNYFLGFWVVCLLVLLVCLWVFGFVLMFD